MSSRDPDMLTPWLADKAKQLEVDCAAKGLEILVISTARHFIEQVALYAQGRFPLHSVNRIRQHAGLSYIGEERNRRRITWTLDSMHVIDVHDEDEDNDLARAFDIVLIKDGRAVWDIKADVNLNEYKDYYEIGEIGEGLGLKWGGRFEDRHGNPNPDWGHFQEPDWLQEV